MAIQFISLFFVNQINFQLANFGSQNKFMRFTGDAANLLI